MSTKKEKAKSKPDAKPKAKEWNVVWKDPNELTPYDKNARKNDATVPYLVNSIKRFGFRVPLVIDAKGVVVCGHTRLKAALNMGMKKVPCVVADDLTNAEIKAFRLADNKTAAMAIWNPEKLAEEMAKLAGTQFTMEGMGFDEEMLGAVGGDLQTGVDNGVDNSGEGGAAVKDTSGELDLDGEFGDDAFQHVCPHCGLKF